MRNSLVRLSLPLLLLLGVLLAAALMLAGKPSTGSMQVAAPMQGSLNRPYAMQVAAPAQNGFTKPEVKLAGPMQNGMDRPLFAGPVQGGFVRLTAGPHSTPLTIPYIFTAGTSIHGEPIVEA